MQQLTSKEIAELFNFVRNKNVPHIDVQFEIVDHLATEIESMISQNPDLDFKKALIEINNSMPLTGFWKIQLEKQKSLKRFWTRHIFNYLLSYITIPKIIISILLFLALSTLFGLTGSTGIIIFSIVLYITLEIIHRTWLNNDSWNSKHYLVSKSLTSSLKTILYIFSWIPFVLIWELFVKNSKVVGDDIGYLIPYISVAYVVMVLIIHATYFVFPKMLENELNIKYQHLKYQ